MWGRPLLQSATHDWSCVLSSRQFITFLFGSLDISELFASDWSIFGMYWQKQEILFLETSDFLSPAAMTAGRRAITDPIRSLENFPVHFRNHFSNQSFKIIFPIKFSKSFFQSNFKRLFKIILLSNQPLNFSRTSKVFLLQLFSKF